MKGPSPTAYRDLLRLALAEDLGREGDLTTRYFLPARSRLSGRIIAKQAGVVCGTEVAAAVFRKAAPGARIKTLLPDGRRVKKGQAVMAVSGGPRVLTAERAALNFLQRLSGVATLTARYVDRVRGTRARILDTRKTLPGWRALDKYAVRCGGGENHRQGLYDMVLLKDNHWAAGRGVLKGVERLRRRHPGVPLEIEAADLRQAARALSVGADIILLDNMSPALLRAAIRLIRESSPKTLVEISGGVTLANVRALAKLGPDRISIGRITHSAPALDLSLEIDAS